MLRALSRALDLSGSVAIDIRWPGPARKEIESLGAEIISGNASGESRQRLIEERADIRLVVNLAGPFYAIGTSVLELALELGTDYLDICDDADATEALLGLHEEARVANARALVGMGSAPGTTNILVRTAVDALRKPEQTNVALKWIVDRADMTPAALDHAFQCLSTALPGVAHVPQWEDLDPHYVDFPSPIGRQLVIRHGHPEPLTLPRFLGVRSATNHGGVSPPEYQHLVWALARQLPQDTKEHRGHGERLHDVLKGYDRIASVENRSGSGLQIDVTADGKGYRFESGSDMAMEDATGIPAAAGVLSMLDRALPEPGVWAPECLDPKAFFDRMRLVSPGGGGLHLLELKDGKPVGRARIRDLLKHGAQRR